MSSSVQRLCVVLVFSILSASMFAQEKTQYYYSTHESEILPDANASFQRGDYERTIELCKWHYIIVGTHSADNLKNKAERCASLKKEMESLRAAGKTMEARDIAKTILSINPSDALAKGVSQIPDPAKPETPSLSKLIPKLIPEQKVDTVVISAPKEPPTLPPKGNEIVSESSDHEGFDENKTRSILERSDSPKINDVSRKKYSYRNRVVFKAGVSVFNLKDLSHTLGVGLNGGVYDIGGSRSGVEICLYDWRHTTLFRGDYKEEDSLLMGLSYVLRLTDTKCPVYAKADVSVFDFDSITLGLGTTFFLGNHLCLELCARVGETGGLIGGNYYYKSGGSMISANLSNVILHPSISIGWAF